MSSDPRAVGRYCRKNALEIELAKARLDLMNLDSQLMEAIQQKIQLSQQLEQWQVRVWEWGMRAVCGCELGGSWRPSSRKYS